VIERFSEAVKKGGKVLICGNGGLAAESEHFAAELMGQYAYPVYIPCIALCANSSLITALANDIGFEDVFSHQVDVLGKEGDVFIGMTTSHSRNIEKAYELALKKNMVAFLLDGETLVGKDVAEKQEYAIKHLHNLARLLKKEVYASRQSEQQFAYSTCSNRNPALVWTNSRPA
jgi:D-sedoheptulose 7-phosphate isomerase